MPGEGFISHRLARDWTASALDTLDLSTQPNQTGRRPEGQGRHDLDGEVTRGVPLALGSGAVDSIVGLPDMTSMGVLALLRPYDSAS